jgi:hypothetical protein
LNCNITFILMPCFSMVRLYKSTAGFRYVLTAMKAGINNARLICPFPFFYFVFPVIVPDSRSTTSNPA